jgi:hypothetical protein
MLLENFSASRHIVNPFSSIHTAVTDAPSHVSLAAHIAPLPED